MVKITKTNKQSVFYIALSALVLSAILALIVKGIKEDFVDSLGVSDIAGPEPKQSLKYDTADHRESNQSDSKLFMFADNKCDVECCGMSEFSCSGGCVCKTKEQSNLLGTRGLNQTKQSGDVF
jgi:hypothetical protein